MATKPLHLVTEVEVIWSEDWAATSGTALRPQTPPIPAPLIRTEMSFQVPRFCALCLPMSSFHVFCGPFLP